MGNAIALVLQRPALTETEFFTNLPTTLIGVLERRYLSALNLMTWSIDTDPADIARPLLREVIELGRPATPSSFNLAMVRVLAACHDPGHSFVALLDAEQGRHRLQFGARRIIGGFGNSTEDYLSAQESALLSSLPGLSLGPIRRLDQGENSELAAFFESAPALGVITGVPPRRDGSPETWQGLEQFASGMGLRRYALMIVAEPIPDTEVDVALDHCRRLKSEIHAYVRSTIQKTKGHSRSESTTASDSIGSWTNNLPAYLYGLVGFCALVPGAGALGAALQGVGTAAAMYSRNSSTGQARQASDTENISESSNQELLDSNAQACEEILDQHIARLQRARSLGWWRSAIYVAAENDATLRAAAGALRATFSTGTAAVDPLRLLTPPDHLIRDSIFCGRLMSLRPVSGSFTHPLGIGWNGLLTCVNSEELATLVAPPRDEIPGLPIRERPAFGLSLPSDAQGTIELGEVQDSSDRNVGLLTLSPLELNRHVFIAGMPGSGKTNTCTQLIRQAFRGIGVPFLVIEPVKREYRSLAVAPEFQGKLRVYSAGSSSGRPLRLNPLSPVPGTPIGRHVDMLKAVFNASFPMFAGMPYILEEALIEVYVERGWSLTAANNPQLDQHATIDQRSALMPDLRDLLEKVDEVLLRKGYGQEVHMNMGAALRSRLHSLLVGSKGLLFDTRRSTPPSDLFEGPAVVELQDLPDEQEKSFLMALLLVLLYEHAESRQQYRPDSYDRLQHITLIEEAHRLLSSSNSPSVSETGDSQGKAISMFVDMLAEMRAYGEGFLIADQVPAQLASQVIKNTSLKIIHRLAAPDDRSLCGSCAGLNEAQTRSLGILRTGEAVVHDDRIGQAVRLRVPSAKLPFSGSTPLQDEVTQDRAFLTLSLHKNAACRSCPSPCSYYSHLRDARAIGDTTDLQPFLWYLYFGNHKEAVAQWKRWRARSLERLGNIFGPDAVTIRGALYCSAAQLGYQWMGSVLLSRSSPIRQLTPRDRVAREAAAVAFGSLLRELSEESEDSQIAAASEAAHRAIRAALAAKPPIEEQGCANCPARCMMLPFVAPRAADLRPELSSASALPAARRVAILERMYKTAIQDSPLRFAPKDTARRDWMYCVAVSIETQDQEALLQQIARAPEVPGNNAGSPR